MMIKGIKHMKLLVNAILFYMFTLLTKKEENLWIFGAWKGTSYGDNARYVFEYVSKEYPNIKAVWITKENEINKFVNSQGFRSVLYSSKEAKNIIKKAKYAFLTEGWRDIGELPIGGIIPIMLWHGIPAKKHNWDKSYSKLKKILIQIESGNLKKMLWTSTAPFYSKAINKLYGVPFENMITCGYTRCDVSSAYSSCAYIDEIKRRYNVRKVILYLPTHRNFGKDFDDNFVSMGFRCISKKLNEKNVCLLYKPHPNEVSLIKNMNTDLDNIEIIDSNDNNCFDLYEYLFCCDALITDYSSVMYDFLCVNKPIVLFPYDIEYFKDNDAGIMPDYFEHPVGPICMTWKEVIEQVCYLLENDTWVNRRSEEYEYFNKYSDGKSCKKLVHHILGNDEKELPV